jgi:hypothetical protein
VSAPPEKRFLISFDKPCRVKLSPEEWKDAYLTRAICRNVLVDLLGSANKPAVLNEARTVAYRIEPAAK